MALDSQRNWNVSMAESLETVIRSRRHNIESSEERFPNKAEARLVLDETTNAWTTNPIHLPEEIIVQILEYVSHFSDSQKTLASCCLLSRQWYRATVPLLYARPVLYGKNFDPFVSTIVPSKNPHIVQSPLAQLVKVLDMRSLVHQSSRRITARLLGRTKNNLEVFVAPQASFAINCFAALGKCHLLRVLDLSLVFESPPLLELLETASHLENLKTFRLPRSSGFGSAASTEAIVWPPKLENLSLSGGLDVHFIHGIASLPTSLRSLTIEHCPQAEGFALKRFLRRTVRPLPNLESLKFANLIRLNGGALDNILFLLPGLVKLSISVDYITPAVFDFDVGSRGPIFESLQKSLEVLPPTSRHQWSSENRCRLQILELTNSGNPGIEDKISPIDILIAIDEGALPRLRQVRVAKSLFWQSNTSAGDVDALVDALKESATHSSDMEELEVGVWAFDEM